MRALIKKEFYLIRSQWISICIVAAVTTVLMGNGGENLRLIPCGFAGMSSSIAVTLFSYDGTAKFDSYGLSLPVGKHKMVSARYLFCFGSLFLFTAVGYAAAVAMADEGDIAGIVGSTQTVLFLVGTGVAVLLPILYKLGIFKLALGVAAVVVVIALYIFLLHCAYEYCGEQWLDKVLLPIQTVTLALTLLLSYLASVRAMGAK